MSKIIKLPGMPDHDPLFTARGELAANLLKLQSVLHAQSFVARELDLPDVADALATVASEIVAQRDEVVAHMLDDEDE